MVEKINFVCNFSKVYYNLNIRNTIWRRIKMKIHYMVKKFTDGQLGIAACNSDRIVVVDKTGTRYRRSVTCKLCKRFLKVKCKK